MRAMLRNARGIAATEFALALPLLLAFLLGTVQLGFLFFANADLRNAVAAGARLASVYPRPSDAAVVAKVNQRIVRLDRNNVVGPTITRARDGNGRDYADIRMSYSMPLDFVFFRTPPITLSETRRVFTQPPSP